MREIKKIIVHCTATPEGRDYNWKTIERWHLQRGFARIGYHYLIRLDGTIEVGREESVAGAHCVGHNWYSIGVCYVGGMDSMNIKAKDTRTAEQKAALLRLLKDLKKRYPQAEILGHRDLANKECPCFDAKGEYEML